MTHRVNGIACRKVMALADCGGTASMAHYTQTLVIVQEECREYMVPVLHQQAASAGVPYCTVKVLPVCQYLCCIVFVSMVSELSLSTFTS